MKEIGFALLLFGIIVAMPASAIGGTVFWYIGIVLGFIGTILVAKGSMK